MQGHDNADALLRDIEAGQRRLRDLIAGRDERLLARRPPSGAWSITENLRHLLFAERAHFHRLLPSDVKVAVPGLPPQSLRDVRHLRMAGNESTSVAEAFAAWEDLHRRARCVASQDTDEVRKALSRNLRHLRAHIKVIDRLLADRSLPNA